MQSRSAALIYGRRSACLVSEYPVLIRRLHPVGGYDGEFRGAIMEGLVPTSRLAGPTTKRYLNGKEQEQWRTGNVTNQPARFSS